MFGIYSQFGLCSNYVGNKNYTTSCFIILTSNRANFAVRGPSSFGNSGRKYYENFFYARRKKTKSNRFFNFPRDVVCGPQLSLLTMVMSRYFELLVSAIFGHRLNSWP